MKEKKTEKNELDKYNCMSNWLILLVNKKGFRLRIRKEYLFSNNLRLRSIVCLFIALFASRHRAPSHVKKIWWLNYDRLSNSIVKLTHLLIFIEMNTCIILCVIKKIYRTLKFSFDNKSRCQMSSFSFMNLFIV